MLHATTKPALHRAITLALVLGATALALLAAGCSPGAARGGAAASADAASALAPSVPAITVSASSEVKVAPDRAQIGVAVTTQASTAAKAQELNAAGINDVIDALKELGIDEKSIQTTSTFLNPRYDYSDSAGYFEDAEETGLADNAEDDSTNIAGYEMTTSLSVKDLAIEQVSEVLQACVAAGANSTDGIQYYASAYDEKYAEALAQAVEAARAKAEVLAQAAGVNLGGVANITEGYQDVGYRYDGGMGVMEAAASDEAMQVMPGEVNVAANITVSFEIA